MCGIIGYVHREASRHEALGHEMLEQVRHRGPDEGYLHFDDGAILGVRRLAIVSVNNGAQPAFSEDGTVVAIFNGEIYNHRDLKEQLTAAGYQIQDGSDAEVIPHAYQEWGSDFASHFNGDFAIAIWDRRRNRLILARDRVGIKPLFYTRTKQGMLFASEIKSLFVDPSVRRMLNPQFLAQLYTFWTGIDGGSPFEGVHQVQAGTVATFSETGRPLGTHRYWDIPWRGKVPAFSSSFEECQTAFRGELRKSVGLRLQADVEVGTYTSGGVDSSVINVVAYRDLGHADMQTFSVAFEDKAFDESEYQRQVVRHLGLKGNEVRLRGDTIYRGLCDAIYHTEAPIFRTAPLAMFFLSRKVSQQGVKVVLTGEGSDEVAWGYDIFREAKIRRFWARQPGSSARPQLFKKLYGYLPQFQDRRHFQLLVDFFKKDMEQTGAPLYSHHTRIANSTAVHVLLSAEFKQELKANPPIAALVNSLPEDYAQRSPLEQCQYLEMRTLLAGYLLSSQGDRMLSAHGVEGRFPYLDHHVVEFLAGVPERFRLQGLQDKAILRATFQHDLPQSIFRRPKFAFRAPELSVFATDPDGIVESHLAEQAIRDAGVFDPEAVQRFRERIVRTPPDRFSTRDNLAFVQILSTQILHDQYVRQFHVLKRIRPASDVRVTRFGERPALREAA